MVGILKEIIFIALIFCFIGFLKITFRLERIFFDLTYWNTASVSMLVLGGYFLFLIFKKDIVKIKSTLYKFRNFLLIFYYSIGVSILISEIFKDYNQNFIYRYGSIVLVAVIVWLSVELYVRYSTKNKEPQA